MSREARDYDRGERGRGRDRDDDRGGRDRDDRGGRDRGDREGRSRDRDDRSRERGPKGGGSARRGVSYRNPDNVRRRTEQTAGNFDGIFKSGVEQWYPKAGENVVRILPATWPDADHYGFDVFVHSYIGSSGSTYICPAKTHGKPCAACDEAKELKAAGEDEASKAMAAKKKTIVYVIDRDDRKPIPKIWTMSWNQDKEIQDGAILKRENLTLYLDDENNGWDLYVKRTGKSLNTRYSYVIDRNPSAIDEDPRTQDDILAFIEENPIPDLLKYADNEQIAKALDGGTRERDRDLDDDRNDRRGGRGRDDRDSRDDRGGRGRDDEREETPRRGRGRDEEDDAPRGRRAGSYEDEEDTKSPRGERMRGGRDEEDDRPARRGRDADDQEDRPARRGRDEEDERPARRGRDEEDSRPARGGKDDGDDRPRSRREPEEDGRPARRGRDEEDDRGSRGGRDDRSARDRDDRDDDRPRRR